mgnify:CR=1 FL=1|jgi:glycosyltransferase involved in cell wall biosynthesis|tara:strand:+ start:35274 stop:36557 length:1284 start_codon:yes stop_codon:yes gene_type:complete
MANFRKAGSNPSIDDIKGGVGSLGNLPVAKKSDKLPLPGEGLSRYIHFNADQSGCGFWRMIWPSEQLLVHNRAVVSTCYQMVLNPHFYMGVDAVRLQRQCTEHQYEFVKALRHFSTIKKEKTGKGFKLIWEVDDVVAPVADIPEYNRCRDAFTNPQIGDTVKRIVHLCDEVSVVSERMRKHYSDFLSYDNISVLPNYFPRNWADRLYDPEKIAKRFDRQKNKPTIGYAGSATHFDIANKTKQRDDFHHVIHDIIKYVDDYNFVFFGGYPSNLTPYVKDGRIKHVPWGNLDKYPTILESLGVDVMIAPLMQNSFSDSKSSIKFLEGAAIGVPVVCQDLPPYEMSPWKFNTSDEMFDHIKMITYDESTYEYASKLARSFIEDFWLDDHLDELQLVYDTPYADESRKKNKVFYANNKSQFDKKKIPVYSV